MYHGEFIIILKEAGFFHTSAVLIEYNKKLVGSREVSNFRS